METPSPELSVPLDELGEPEAEGSRLPRAPLPSRRHSRVVHRVEEEPEWQTSFNGDLQNIPKS